MSNVECPSKKELWNNLATENTPLPTTCRGRKDTEKKGEMRIIVDVPNYDNGK